MFHKKGSRGGILIKGIGLQGYPINHQVLPVHDCEELFHN